RAISRLKGKARPRARSPSPNTPSPARLIDNATRQVKSITIRPGGQMLGGNNSTLEVFGALQVNNGTVSWENAGSFEAGTSTVIFKRTLASIAGSTVFNNITIPHDTCSLILMNGSTTYVSGVFSKTPGAVFDAIFDGPTTFGYSGSDQTVFLPAGNEYYHLQLSGSGTKTMTTSAMAIRGDLTLAGTASATAGNSLNIDGNLLIGSGATLGTGTFSHQIKGDLTCDGTITPASGSMITMNGSSAQSIQGDAATIALGGLSVSNTSGVTLKNHATTAALNISSGLFTVIAGKSITASGNTTITPAQGLVLKSDESGTASFIDNGTISGSGTARIERYLTKYDAVSDLKFHFLSSPVGNTQSIENEFVDLSSSDITDFYKWNEPANVWTNYRGATYDVRNEDFGDEFKFVPGKGYLVAYPADVVKNFVGAPYTNALGLTVNCTNTSAGGWNLIGNPFPSSINWNSLAKSNVEATLYYYDNSVPGYKYYNTTSGGIGGATENIAPMQGFMVHATSAGSIAISNDARTHSGQDVFYKSVQLTTNILDLKVEGSNKTDYARVCFYDQATESFDGDFDAYKLFSYSDGIPELYTLAAGDVPLAINTGPLSKLKGSVAMGFKPGAQGSYTVTAENIGSFDSEAVINLEDLATGTIQELTKNPVYSFTAGPDDNASRFMLHFFAPVSIDEPESSDLMIYNYGQEIRVIIADASTLTFTLVNLQGQVVYTRQLSGSSSYALSLNLPAGIYVARVMNTRISKAQKLIIK
ncbi:MAG: T9SS type A sorting domain-containing protein, partial [Lentimicrobium sp.]|nr:T9SS type A sorting domain-containing protein [Lentimicrobium sp.]